MVLYQNLNVTVLIPISCSKFHKNRLAKDKRKNRKNINTNKGGPRLIENSKYFNY